MNRFATTDEFLPPQNLEAERSSLGACQLSKRAAREVKGIIKPEMFWVPAHREIAKVVFEMVDRGEEIDFITLPERLGAEKLDECGGIDYLVQIAESCPSAANARYYANIVLEKWQDRTAEARLHSSLKNLLDGQREDAYKEMSNLLVGLQRGKASEIDWESAVNASGAGLGFGVPCFLNKYNQATKTNGFARGQFHVYGAQSGAGKSTALCSQVRHVGSKGLRIAVVSLEMSAEELAHKMVQQETGYISLHNAECCGAGDVYREALDFIGGFNLCMFDGSADFEEGVTVQKVLQWLSEKHAYDPLDFAIIDYLQILESDCGKDGPQLQHKISKKCRGWAKSTGVPLWGLAQIQFDNSPDGWTFRYGGKYQEDSCSTMIKRVIDDEEYVEITKNRFGGKKGKIKVKYDPRHELMEEV